MNRDVLLKVGFVVLSIFSVIKGNGQSIVPGRVLSANDSLPVVGANVIAKNSQGKIVSFSTTDTNGDYKLSLKSISDSLTLTVSMIGYSTYSSPLTLDRGHSLIYLKEGTLELKEVLVRANRINESGDTVTYNVGAFAEKQDRSIGDVLNRMPGINVLQNGRIQYQGTDINKFYIEGNDLLEGRYGIATNGVNHEDVSQVEVLENHQPMQVLHGLSYSDQAAINLKLKSKSKASLLVHGNIGAGCSEQPSGIILDGDVFAMIIRGDYQNITTLKGNNTGDNINDELTDYTIPQGDERLTPYVNLSIPSMPNMRQKRSYFNRSWLISTNNLWKTHNGDNIKAQVNYSSNRIEGYSGNTITYFLGEGDRILTENKSSLTHSNELDSKFVYESNKKNYYLNNTLTASFGWNDISLSTTGTLPNEQIDDTRSFSVTNYLKLIKRYGNNKLVSFYSLNQWEYMPEVLNVNSAHGKSYGDKISQYSFYTDERASLGFIIKHVTLSLEAGLTGYFRSLKTNLWGVAFEENASEGEGPLTGMELKEKETLTTDYLGIFANPKFEWGSKKIELTLEVPVNLYNYFFSGGLSNQTQFFLSPSLRARFKINTRSSLIIRGSAHRSPASLHDIHDSSIMTNYRTFLSGVDKYYANSGQSVVLSYSYRNGPIGIFVTGSGSYGWSHSKFMLVSDMLEDYIFYSYRSNPSNSNNVSAIVTASKTLEFIRGAIGLRSNYRMNKRTMVSQGKETCYSAGTFTFNPYFNGSIARCINWTLKFLWSHSRLNIRESTDRTTDNFMYACDLSVLPFSFMTCTLSGEFYRNQLENCSYKNMMMLDAKMTFNLSKKIDLSLSMTNLLNKKYYNFTNYGILSQSESSSLLRGREFMITVHLKK